MASLVEKKLSELSVEGESTYKPIPFGKEMLSSFLFAPEYKNMNHGSFGASPRAIQEKRRELQDQCEARPDPFIRYDYPTHLDESREAVAKLLNCPTSTVVFVANATTGVNTVLRNIVWDINGKDEILYFRHIYGACLKTIEYVCEANHDIVAPREIVVTYPMEDADLLDLFQETIKASRAAGKNPRIAIFDTVSSLPGLRMPFEDLTAICKKEGVLSLIDGAHGVGHIHLDLTALDPDFFVSNLHKWLFVPRGCAVFYVPERNQPLIRSSLPTSHGFIPKSASNARNPLPPSSKSVYVTQFEFVGTIDNTNYLVVAEAIKWREKVCGGEKSIMDHNIKLSCDGGKEVAQILGTEILDNKTQSLTNCCLVNVLLPLTTSPVKSEGVYNVPEEHVSLVGNWIQNRLIDEHHTFVAIFHFQDQFWARLSGQVYLDMSDFEWTGHVLKELCERVGKEEYLTAAKQ